MQSVSRVSQLVFAWLACMSAVSASAETLPEFSRSLGQAGVVASSDRLRVSTGRIEREWRLTPHGLATVSLKDLRTGRTWAAASDRTDADWNYPGVLADASVAELIDLSVNTSTDGSFTSEHLEIAAEFAYPADGVSVRYVIWAYPEAPGLRTQLFLKRDGGDVAGVSDSVGPPRIEVVVGGRYLKRGSEEIVGEPLASNLNNPSAVKLHAKGLDTSRSYVLGLSWWDYNNANRRARVRVTSVDGETTHTVIPETRLPNWRKDKQPPAELTARVPGDVMLDDTFRILIERITGHNANVSEVWLYESFQSGESVTPVPGPTDRIAAISGAAPEGFRLAAYLDAGALPGSSTRSDIPTARVDFLPIQLDQPARRYIGYYNDMQHRNKPETPVLREVVKPGSRTQSEAVAWANAVSIESGDAGVIVLKESHKCVNQAGVDTGRFVLDEQGLHTLGGGLGSNELRSDYRWLWASWCLVYDGGDLGRELAIKAFDRARWPVNLELDAKIVNVLWYDSSLDKSRWHRGGNVEYEVLQDLAANADLGTELVLIDDGWFHPKDKKQWDGKTWRPHPEPWPNGWQPVVDKAGELGLAMGLWGVAQRTPVEDMIWNAKQLGVKLFKLDFANLDQRNELEDMVAKARAYVTATGFDSHILWDTTENAPRFGWWWLREGGLLHAMNRKHHVPGNVVYVPWLTLRDIWLLSKYQNLNQIMLTSCVPSRVSKKNSDAHQHPADYCFATTMMGVPHIQASVRDYAPEEAVQLKALIAAYKPHRDAIFQSYVTPIGDQPDNQSWTGFQTLTPGHDTGYLLVLRELKNTESTVTIQLADMVGKRLALENLLSGVTTTVTVDAAGRVRLTIPEAPGFQFLRYRVMP